MNRRNFINALLYGLSATLPGVPGAVLAQQHRQVARRLVLVELAGANDGLNTLVPYNNDHYRRLRPSIGLSREQVLDLGNDMGLHEALRPLMKYWENGSMAWVQGLGYPKANRSHFQSIALWERANDGTSKQRRNGWITHAVEHLLARPVHDPHGISIDGNMALFASDSGRWMSTRSADKLRDNSLPQAPENAQKTPSFALLQHRLDALNDTMSQLSGKLETVPNIPKFEGGRFAEQLRQVCILIAAGLDTPVYRVRLSGFDTHDKQAPRHTKLLQTLAQGLHAFSHQLNLMSEWNNTLIMTYSEFGRRAAENRSGGTDHGTAAPHLLLGGDVKGGVYGQAPDLADLVDQDPLFTMDYRALYHRVLVDGLGAESHPTSLAEYADNRLDHLIGKA